MAERVEADVCIVGAGYAGLTAARRLTQAGKTVAVLEARDRVGGRIWTQQTASGATVDRGGGWLAAKHDAAHALAAELGVSTYKTHVAGKHLLVGGGRTRTYKGLIPKISPLAVLTIARAQRRIDRMAKQVPLEAPWTAAKADEWDAQSLGDVLETTGIRTEVARDLFEMAVRGLHTGDLHDVSLLNLLMLVRGHHSLETLFSIDGGAQENLVDGGAGAMAQRMAADLFDAVYLRSPVRAITQQRDNVVVTAEAETGGVIVHAPRVVVTVPPALALDIQFTPALPDDRAALYRGMVAGPESKTLLVYDEPFWRADGFSGQTAEPGSPAEVTIDASPADAGYGVLASFTFSHVAEQYDAMPADERRRLLLETLSHRLGPKTASPIEIVETAWWHEEWTRGCSMAHFKPGILTSHGHLLREPWGRIHWAGTETATTSHGAIDGAIRSGERAARESLAAL
jgi:monoamine oxidase